MRRLLIKLVFFPLQTKHSNIRENELERKHLFPSDFLRNRSREINKTFETLFLGISAFRFRRRFQGKDSIKRAKGNLLSPSTRIKPFNFFTFALRISRLDEFTVFNFQELSLKARKFHLLSKTIFFFRRIKYRSKKRRNEMDPFFERKYIFASRASSSFFHLWRKVFIEREVERRKKKEERKRKKRFPHFEFS